MAGKDAGLQTLLELSEQVIDQEDGYWVKTVRVRPQASPCG
jgi:hypothetical protein